MILYSYKTEIKASPKKLWELMTDKIRRPDKYVPGVQSVSILQEHGPLHIEREMIVKDEKGEKVITESISADPHTKTVIFKLRNDAYFNGYVLNIIYETEDFVELEYLVCWTPKGDSLPKSMPDMEKAIKNAVEHAKSLAEQG